VIRWLKWKWHKHFTCATRRSRVGGSIYFVWSGHRICECGHYIDGKPEQPLSGCHGSGEPVNTERTETINQKGS
jgi:hypothetical protein